MVEKHDLHILQVKLSYWLITVAYMNIYPIEHSNSNEWTNGMWILVHLDIKYSATLLNPLVCNDEFNYVAALPMIVDCGHSFFG